VHAKKNITNYLQMLLSVVVDAIALKGSGRLWARQPEQARQAGPMEGDPGCLQLDCRCGCRAEPLVQFKAPRPVAQRRWDPML